jgi:hypothetical protein
MTIGTRLLDELRTVAVYTLLFSAWFFFFTLAKVLILAQYEIRAGGVSAAVVFALILAKVVLVLEHVSLGEWTRVRPAWVEVAARTALYGVGVLVVLLAEKAFELRREAEGVTHAMLLALRHEHAAHVVADAICVTGALLLFNAMSVVRRHLGVGGLRAMFLAPLPEAPPAARRQG